MFRSFYTALYPRERYVLWILLILLCLAVVLPPVPLPAHYHDFADQRALAGLPHAADVLSNLPFAVLGFWGLWRLHKCSKQGVVFVPPLLLLYRLTFWGLVSTCLGSSYYHYLPSDWGLLWDRLGMSLAFAGTLALAVAHCVSLRAAFWAAWVIGVAALLSCYWAYAQGNVLPWSFVQGAGLVLLCCAAYDSKSSQRPDSVRRLWPIGWGWMIVAYALAKVFELADVPIYTATGYMLSGHTIKHLFAAAACWPVLVSLQNGPANLR